MLIRKTTLAFVLFTIFAWTTHVQGATNGENAITYPLEGNVADGTELPITWTPSTEGTVTINLMKGPQDNLVDLGPIIENLENDGEFLWTIPTSLEGQDSMPPDYVYGIKIIVDADQTYEYSPPFNMVVPGSTYSAGDDTAILAAAVAEASETATEEDPTETSADSETASSETEKSVKPRATDDAEKNGQGISNIFVIPSAIVGGIALLIAGLLVFLMIRGDKRKRAKRLAALPPEKSFRDRHSFDAPSPIQHRVAEIAATRNHHRRFPSTSSFGDNEAPMSDADAASLLAPGIRLSSRPDSPPPTPFAAPPMTFPPVIKLPQKRKSRAFPVSPQFNAAGLTAPAAPDSPPPTPRAGFSRSSTRPSSIDTSYLPEKNSAAWGAPIPEDNRGDHNHPT